MRLVCSNVRTKSDFASNAGHLIYITHHVTRALKKTFLKTGCARNGEEVKQLGKYTWALSKSSNISVRKKMEFAKLT